MFFSVMLSRAQPRSEDPTILSGTLRSTLDVFDEYEDAQIVRTVFALDEPLLVAS